MKLLELSTLIALAAASSVPAASGRPSPLARRPFGASTTPKHRRHPDCCPSAGADGVLSLRGGAVHESTSLNDLESRIESAALQGKLTVIDFTATWCGPCKAIAPVFKDLSGEFGSRATFLKVDVDENPEAAQKYGVSAMPTFLFVKGGEVVEKVMGANAERLRELVEELAL